MKKISVTIIAIFFCTSLAWADSSGVRNLEAQELKNYVINLIDDTYNTFNDKTLSDADKTIEFKKLLRSHLYLDWMARYSLGSHRRLISKDKTDHFVKIYSLFVVNSYIELLSKYSGEKARLRMVKQIDDDLFMVNLEVIKSNAEPPIKIDYLVHKIYVNQNNYYLIGDIITEGVSILNTQKSEFNSMIAAHGIDSLIADLQSRISQ